MVRYMQTSRVQQPDGSTSVVDVSVVTTSLQRKRTDDRFGTYVIECDRQRTISWSSRDKGYVVESFAELAREYVKIDEAMRKSGESEYAATVHDAPDARTMIIDGITAHHLVETVIDLPNNSVGTSVSDAWYSAGADPFTCPAFDAIGPPPNHLDTTSNPSKGGSGGFGVIFSGALGGPQVPAGSIVLRESTRMGFGVNSATEVTAIKTIPYDPTYFEPPANFVQATPRPLPSFPPHTEK
jgi:hypothetical protein